MKDIDIYNIVRDHLVNQGMKSTDEEGVCFYRGEYGLKCAVGCIVLDENYNEEIEHNSATDTRVLEAVALSFPEWKISNESISMLVILQRIHDRIEPRLWTKYLDILKLHFDDGKFGQEVEENDVEFFVHQMREDIGE